MHAYYTADRKIALDVHPQKTWLGSLARITAGCDENKTGFDFQKVPPQQIFFINQHIYDMPFCCMAKIDARSKSSHYIATK